MLKPKFWKIFLKRFLAFALVAAIIGGAVTAALKVKLDNALREISNSYSFVSSLSSTYLNQKEILEQTDILKNIVSKDSLRSKFYEWYSDSFYTDNDLSGLFAAFVYKDNQLVNYSFDKCCYTRHSQDYYFNLADLSDKAIDDLYQKRNDLTFDYNDFFYCDKIVIVDDKFYPIGNLTYCDEIISECADLDYLNQKITLPYNCGELELSFNELDNIIVWDVSDLVTYNTFIQHNGYIYFLLGSCSFITYYVDDSFTYYVDDSNFGDFSCDAYDNTIFEKNNIIYYNLACDVSDENDHDEYEDYDEWDEYEECEFKTLKLETTTNKCYLCDDMRFSNNEVILKEIEETNNPYISQGYFRINHNTLELTDAEKAYHESDKTSSDSIKRQMLSNGYNLINDLLLVRSDSDDYATYSDSDYGSYYDYASYYGYNINVFVKKNILFEIFGRGLIGFYIFLLILAALISALMSYIAYIKSMNKYKNERLQRTLVNSMAHDLKTPLMAISGYAENMLDSGNLNDKETEYAGSIMDTVGYMNDTISNLLGFSNSLADSSQNKKQKKKTEIDMTEITEKCAERYKVLTDERGLAILCDGELKIKASAECIERIIDNILSNAVKYARENSDIKISYSPEKWVFENKFDGSLGNAEKLTEAFVMGDEARSNGKGHGLGLAIAKNLAEREGYSLTVETVDDIFKVTVKKNCFQLKKCSLFVNIKLMLLKLVNCLIYRMKKFRKI